VLVFPSSRSREEFKMSEESIDSYFKSIKSRNYPLEGLDAPVLCGVVLHDEANALLRAEEGLRKQGLKVIAADSTKRFRGWTVDLRRDHECKRVLLLETGMGSMNASLVMYELEASLRGKPDKSRRILKIGTCSGLYEEELADKVLVPACALNDEGATQWNQDTTNWDGRRWEDWENDLVKRLEKTPCEPDGRPSTRPEVPTLTDDWRNYLREQCGHQDWGTLFVASRPQPAGRTRRAAIWSIDNFHAVRLLVKHRIYPLIQRRVDQWPDAVPVGLENECSSHFSASCRLKLPMAAALVVSWSCIQVSELATTGTDTRGELKDRVHKTETCLIVHAVNYLLYQNWPIAPYVGR
jgi:uridine phosphorylase